MGMNPNKLSVDKMYQAEMVDESTLLQYDLEQYDVFIDDLQGFVVSENMESMKYAKYSDIVTFFAHTSNQSRLTWQHVTSTLSMSKTGS